MNVTEITSSDPMMAMLNRGLMVQWINADLINRASCDVRTSFVLYDADRTFITALAIGRDEFLNLIGPRHADLIAAGVHYYSHGIA